MVRPWWCLSAALALAGCGLIGTGKSDLGGSGDASIDSAPPPDGPPAYTLTASDTTLLADGFTTITLVIHGEPGADVVLAHDPPTIDTGTFLAPELTLDGGGGATTTFHVCDALAHSECLVDPTITVALASDPGTVRASLPLHLTRPDTVGPVDECLTGGNVLYAADFGAIGTFKSSPTAAFTANVLPGFFDVTVVDGGHSSATFNLQKVVEALDVGIYTDARRNADSDHPGLDVDVQNEGCSSLAGAFQVYDYTADDDTGQLTSLTIAFRERCEGESPNPPPPYQGCLHFEQTFPPPVDPNPEPPPGPDDVTITVLAGSAGPDTAAQVVFTDAFGAVVSDTTTDSNGVARAAMPFGGEVTVIQPQGANAFITTFRQILPGDELHLGDPTPGQAGGISDGMLVKSDPPPDAGAINYLTACQGDPSVGGDIQFSDACRTPTFSMLSVTSPPMPGQPTDFAFQSGLAHHANGVVPGPTSADWHRATSSTVSVANLPASVQLDLNLHWITALDTLEVFGNGLRVHPPYATPPAATLTSIPGAPAVLQVETVNGFGFSDIQQQLLADSPATATLDYAALPLPVLSGFHHTATGGNWTETGSGAPDVRIVFWNAQFHDPSAPAVTRQVRWTVVEDPSVATPGQFSLPSLPASHAVFDATLDPNAFGLGNVEYLDWDFITGYDEIRETSLVLRSRPLARATPYRLHRSISP